MEQSHVTQRRTSRLVKAKPGAAEIGVPYTTIRDAVFRGEIAVVKMGRAWYFERRDLDRWIESRKERVA